MANQSLIVGWRERWNRSLLRFLRGRVRSPIDIEDLAQETYLRLLRARDLTDVLNPQAYLLRVAGHVLAEWRDRQQPGDPLTSLDENLFVDSSNPESESDTVAAQSRLERTLASVSPAMRAVLILRFRDELSYKEIADALSMTNRQVRRYLIRGFEHLRQTLDS